MSTLILFSSIQEGMSQFSSIMFSTESCCASQPTDTQDDTCDIDDTKQADTCCEGAVCDCTCCIHISLFNTSFGELSFQEEIEDEIFQYVDAQPLLISSPFFHPPLV